MGKGKAKAIDPCQFVHAVYTEREPRPGEALCGAELYEHVCRHFGQDEVDVPMLPIQFYLDALAGEDPKVVTAAAFAASLNYHGLRDAIKIGGYDPTADFLYHTFGALRIRLDCRFAELSGEQSPQRLRIH